MQNRIPASSLKHTAGVRMDIDNLFHWIGEKIGAAIRLIVDALAWMFDNLYGVFDSFIAGLTAALGINSSLFSVAVLIIGVVMLFAAVSALIRRHVVVSFIWAALSLIVLSWLIQ